MVEAAASKQASKKTVYKASTIIVCLYSLGEQTLPPSPFGPVVSYILSAT